MADSKRETILVNIETTLKTITTANGYNFNVVRVSRNFGNWQKYNEFPVLFIIPGRESADPNPNNEYTRKIEVRILGMTDANKDINDAGLLSKEMEKLLQDVVKAMLVDIHRGNPDWVDYTFFQGCDPLYDWAKQRGFLAIDFEVQYHHDYTSM